MAFFPASKQNHPLLSKPKGGSAIAGVSYENYKKGLHLNIKLAIRLHVPEMSIGSLFRHFFLVSGKNLMNGNDLRRQDI